MSTTVIAKGKLIPTGLNLKDFLTERGYECSSVSKMMDDFYDNFDNACLIGDNVYLVDGTVEDYHEDVAEAKLNPDGSIDYLCVYYNGGCSRDEAIRYAVKNNIENPS